MAAVIVDLTEATYGVLCALDVTRRRGVESPSQAVAIFTRAAEERSPGITKHVQLVPLPRSTGLSASTAQGETVLQRVLHELQQQDGQKQTRGGQPRT